MRDLREGYNVICKINTPWFKKGEVVERFDLDIDRLDYPDIFRALTSAEQLRLKYYEADQEKIVISNE